MIDFRPLDDSNRLAFEELLREPWQCLSPATLPKDIIQWRFFDKSQHGTVTWLAMDKSECVAMLNSMLRPYLLNGQRILVRETSEWYCTPRVRSRATGLWLLMHHMKMHPEPILSMGGTSTNVNILSKMRGWVSLPTSSTFILPLKARGLAANWIRHHNWSAHESLARFIPDSLPAKKPRRIKSPPRSTIRLFDPSDSISLPLPDKVGLTQLFEQQQWAWLVNMPPNLARPIGVQFFQDDALIGFSCLQIEPTITGLDGKIIYLQVSDQSLTAWVISETTRIAADYGVGFIRCCVSTPSKIKAMRQVGYIKTRDLACHWWQSTYSTPACVDVGLLHGESVVPFHAIQR